MNSNNSGKKWVDELAVKRLVFIIIWLLLFVVCHDYSQYVTASGLETGFSNAGNLSKKDEQVIDKFLDEVLGIDPASITLENEQLDENKPLSSYGFSFFAGYGAEKNILDSNWLKLNSNKYYTTADFYYSRTRNRINKLSFYVFLDNTQYPDLESENDKGELFTRAQGKFWTTDTNALGASLSYYYQLSFDVDNVVKNEPIPEYKNEEYTATPSWEINLGNGGFLKTELEVLNKRSQEAADSFDRFKLITQLKIVYGKGSESRITLDADTSSYDTGEILDLDGYTLENTKLKTESQSLGLINSHNWSGNSRINLRSNLVFLRQRDNGPGYYNYDYYYLGETFQFQLAEWKFSSTLRLTQYQYAERKGSSVDSNSEALYNSLFEIDTKLERKFGDDFLVKLETVSFQSVSNDLSLEYTSDSVLFGLIWFL